MRKFDLSDVDAIAQRERAHADELRRLQTLRVRAFARGVVEGAAAPGLAALYTGRV